MLSQKADRALAGPVAFGLLVTPVCLGIYAAAKANHLWGTKRGAQERSLVSMRFLLRALIRSCFWLKVEEPEEEDWNALALPQDKGCILMFNHTSMFDGFLMAAICVEIKLQAPHAIVATNLTHWLISTQPETHPPAWHSTWRRAGRATSG